MRKKPFDVLMVASFPPPVSGMPVVNQHMHETLQGKCKIITIDTAPDTERPIVHYLGRLLAWVRALLTVGKLRASGTKVYYASVDDGWGMFLNIWVALLAQILGYRLFLHHHSYRYIVKKSRLMSFLVWAAGPEATHIFLCSCMNYEMRQLYVAINNSTVCANKVDCPSQSERPDEKSSSELVIGMLSNLTFEKGVDTFLALLQDLRKEGLAVRGVLAGPISSTSVLETVESASQSLGGALEWRGAVFGSSKEQFFQDIDVFIFPTRYKTESFGLVLLEALIRGRPVIAPARGCITLFSSLNSAFIVEQEAVFTETSKQKIREFSENEVLLRQLQCCARKEGTDLNNAFLRDQDKLADLIVSAASGS